MCYCFHRGSTKYLLCANTSVVCKMCYVVSIMSAGDLWDGYVQITDVGTEMQVC